VAGVAAAYLSANPTATPAQVTAAILDGATRDVVTDPMGSPNRLLNARVVDRTPPSLKIVSPSAGDHVPAAFRVMVDTQDPNLVAVALKIDDTVIGTLDREPFGFDVPALSTGSHTLTVTSADAAGQISEQQINVTVDADGAGVGDGEIAGGCSAGGTATLPVALFILGALVLRRRRSELAAVTVCSAFVAACVVGDETPPSTTTQWAVVPCTDPIVDTNQDGIPDGLDLDCDGSVDIDLTGGGGGSGSGSGSGGGGGGGSVYQCNSINNEKSIKCARIDNNPADCECRIDDQLVRTCTTTSNSACSFPGPDNCCGF
jgi:uncharacterized protein (TIGR03382 family)